MINPVHGDKSEGEAGKVFYDSLIQRFSGKTARDVVTVFVGNSLRSVLGFVSNLLVIRWLGPVGFGTVAAAHAAMTLAAQAVDFGLSTSSVRYGSKYLEKSPERTAIIFKITLCLKFLLGLPVLVVLIYFSPAIAARVFGKTELTMPLMIAFGGSFCFLLVNFPLGVLQTYRRFKSYMLVSVFQGVIQILLVAILFFTGNVEPNAVVIVLAVTPFIAFTFGWMLLPGSFLGARGDVRGVMKEIMGFGKWITISTFATMFIMRLDVLMLTAMSPSSEVGKYASASQLAYLFPLITGALTTALLPKATGLIRTSELRRYVLDTLRITPLAIIIAVPLFLFAGPIVRVLFGARYLEAVPIFKVLLTSFVLSVILNPAALILYSLDRADLLAYMNLLQLGINFLGNLFLIPSMGGFGAALSTLAVRLFGSVFIIYCLKKFLFSGGTGQATGQAGES